MKRPFSRWKRIYTVEERKPWVASFVIDAWLLSLSDFSSSALPCAIRRAGELTTEVGLHSLGSTLEEELCWPELICDTAISPLT
jgi:hypothetical protein